MQGRTTLVIAHRLSTVVDADQILLWRKDILRAVAHTILYLRLMICIGSLPSNNYVLKRNNEGICEHDKTISSR